MRKAHLKWWKDTLDLETLGDLTGSLPEVEKALRDLESDGKSGKTLQNYSESLAAFCDWSVSRGYLESDPLGELAKFDTSPRTKRRAMTGDEMIRLLRSCAAHRRLCYEVAFTSGLRAGELRALRVDNLDTVRCGIRLEASWTKNRKAGFQPLPNWLVKRLQEASTGKGPNELLLYVPSHPGRDLDHDLEQAGIAKWSSEGKLDFHACRVAYVTSILEAGASAKEAQVLARHSTANLTLNVYGRARKDRLVEVTEVVGRSVKVASTTGAQRGPVAKASHSGNGGLVNLAAGSTPAASISRERRSAYCGGAFAQAAENTEPGHSGACHLALSHRIMHLVY
jgi:integrase